MDWHWLEMYCNLESQWNATPSETTLLPNFSEVFIYSLTKSVYDVFSSITELSKLLYLNVNSYT